MTMKHECIDSNFKFNVGLPGVNVMLIFAGLPDGIKGHGCTVTLAVSLCEPVDKLGNIVTSVVISGSGCQYCPLESHFLTVGIIVDLGV